MEEKKRLAAAKARFIMDRRNRRKKSLPILPIPHHLRLTTGSLENPQASTSATARQEMADEIAQADNEPTERLTENREGSAPVTKNPVLSTSQTTEDTVPSTSRETKQPVSSTSRATEDPVPSTSGTASVRQDTRNKAAKEKWREIFRKKPTKRPGEELINAQVPKLRRVHQIGSSLYDSTMRELNKGGLAPPNIYSNKTLVLDTLTCKMYIERVEFKRQTKFSSTNRLFRVTVVTKPQTKSPLMLDSLELLRTALNHIITDIQSSYDKNKARQIYLTLSDKRNMTQSGINTANFPLHADKMHIIQQCLDRFFIFLQSHRDMELTSSFNIDAKVLGLEHVQHRLKGRKMGIYIPHTQTENQPPVEAVEDEAVAEEPGPVGTGYYSPGTPALSGKWFFSPPRGIPGQKLLFANKCLLVAAIFGIWRIRAAISRYNNDCDSEDVKMWQIMEGLYAKKDQDKKRAGLAIDEEMRKVCALEDIDMNQKSYTAADILPKLAAHYCCQYVVYSDRRKYRILFQSSKPMLDSLPIVLLFQQMNTDVVENSDGRAVEQKDHIYLITNQFSFQIETGFECYHCFKVYKGKRPTHRCSAKVQYSTHVILLSSFCTRFSCYVKYKRLS